VINQLHFKVTFPCNYVIAVKLVFKPQNSASEAEKLIVKVRKTYSAGSTADGTGTVKADGQSTEDTYTVKIKHSVSEIRAADFAKLQQVTCRAFH